MGTRAAFWIGDPRDVNTREWLGCKSWDGHPSNFEELAECSSVDDFRKSMAAIADQCRKDNDWAESPGGWPYPWAEDIFVTDFNYAFFDGTVQVACFHHGFKPMAEVLKEDFEWPEHTNLSAVPAGMNYDRSQPDSIIIVSSRP